MNIGAFLKLISDSFENSNKGGRGGSSRLKGKLILDREGRRRSMWKGKGGVDMPSNYEFLKHSVKDGGKEGLNGNQSRCRHARFWVRR